MLHLALLTCSVPLSTSLTLVRLFSLSFFLFPCSSTHTFFSSTHLQIVACSLLYLPFFLSFFSFLGFSTVLSEAQEAKQHAICCAVVLTLCEQAERREREEKKTKKTTSVARIKSHIHILLDERLLSLSLFQF